ncbi:DNA primase subunit pri2 [Sorochytrium milnesiophthora]
MFARKSERSRATAAGSSSGSGGGGAGAGKVLLPTEFPHRLSLYLTPPSHELSVEEFELCAWDRLQLLKAIEAAQIRNKEGDDLRTAMEVAEQKYLPLTWDKADVVKAEAHRVYQEQRKKDNTSHFVLRLAYAKSEDLRAWLVRQETMLFRLRLERADSKERAEFIRSLNMQMQEVDPAERDVLLEKLRASMPHVTDIEQETLYKVEWESVPDLVGQRKVFVKDGFAYITPNEQKSLVANDFKLRLQRALEACPHI